MLSRAERTPLAAWWWTIDRVALTIAVIGQAMPSFWFALTLMLWLGVYWRLLPITGSDSSTLSVTELVRATRTASHTGTRSASASRSITPTAIPTHTVSLSQTVRLAATRSSTASGSRRRGYVTCSIASPLVFNDASLSRARR